MTTPESGIAEQNPPVSPLTGGSGDATAESGAVRQHRFALPPGATDLIVVRHGETVPAHPDRRFDLVGGHGDPPLDPRGHTEAQRVAERLAGAGVTAIYVTSLQRTHQTAAPLAARTGLTPVEEPDLREVYLGEWEGGLFPVRMREFGPVARRVFAEERWDVIPGAEPLEELQDRLRGAVERIVAAHTDERVVVVTHGGVIGTLFGMASGGRPFAFIGADNASVSHLVVTADGGWIVRRFNDTSHLATDLDAPPV